MTKTDHPILEVENLRIERLDGKDIVAEVSFSVSAGEILAIVGESGSGKTSVALALLGHTRPGTRVSRGSVSLNGTDLLQLSSGDLRRTCGAKISFVPQDPGASLNPRHRIGDQIREAEIVHRATRATDTGRAAELLELVGLSSSTAFQRRYAFELSGGQQQRVAIAMALACRPRVIVLDEPTTGLDVTTQARILDLLADLAATTSTAYIYVTHDLAVVNRIATHVAVMYAGRMVESGSSRTLLSAPLHPYASMLIDSVPRLHVRAALTGIAGTAPPPTARPIGCFFAPRCPLADTRCHAEFPPPVRTADGDMVRCWRAGTALPRNASPKGVVEITTPQSMPILRIVGLAAGYGRGKTRSKVIEGISFDLAAGECLALVGESGSGKSTIGRCIAGLHRPNEGSLIFHGNELAPHAILRKAEQLRSLQIVFQNPERSLNPHETVGDAIMRPIRQFSLGIGRDARVMAADQLDRVRLPKSAINRYPRELSGGEKQRVAIARALAAGPTLMICDEITSALDVSTQAAIVNLLEDLRHEGLTLLFITHNLALVRAIADRVLVLQAGRIQEYGAVNQVIEAPVNAYTRELLAAAPDLS